jgi:hypothetical protein
MIIIIPLQKLLSLETSLGTKPLWVFPEQKNPPLGRVPEFSLFFIVFYALYVKTNPPSAPKRP